LACGSVFAFAATTDLRYLLLLGFLDTVQTSASEYELPEHFRIV
jgi:hypothetical protein